jgi:protein arginine N-methyltransferase 1
MSPPSDRLTAETSLALRAGVRTRRDAAGHILVDSLSGSVVDAGPDGFAILAMFSPPRTLADALTELGRRPDSIQAAGVVLQLIESGVLLDAADGDAPQGWADPVEHAWMLHDHRRTGSYLAAIEEVVRSGDVVLDLGTGSGILAVAAARAGARRVFAIEASDIASVAADVFEINGVGDRVTLIEGWSTDVELPEPADVLVSEIIGSEPLEEEVLETTLDARQRLLRPDPRVIPSSLRLDARPLAVPRDERWSRTIPPEAIDDLQRRYGVDLTPLFAARRRHAVHWPTDDHVVAGWPSLGPPAELITFDLCTMTSAAVDASARLSIDREGAVDAILVTFRATLSPGVELAHTPRREERSSWSSSVWMLPERIDVDAGSRLRVTYTRRSPGRADGLTCVLEPS